MLKKNIVFSLSRSTHPRCSIKKAVLKISQCSQENTCVGVTFLIKLQATLFKRDSNASVFCEYNEIFKSTIFEEHLWTAASDWQNMLISRKRENWKTLISLFYHVCNSCTLKFLFIQLCSWDAEASKSWWFKNCFPFLYLKKNTLTSCILWFGVFIHLVYVQDVNGCLQKQKWNVGYAILQDNLYSLFR